MRKKKSGEEEGAWHQPEPRTLPQQISSMISLLMTRFGVLFSDVGVVHTAKDRVIFHAKGKVCAAMNSPQAV